MKIQGSIVLVRPEGGEKIVKGIVIPASNDDSIIIGDVVDIGCGVEEVRKGDKVYYPWKRSSRIIIDDIEHHFVEEDDILLTSNE